MIYFDNAASSEINPELIPVYSELLTKYYANQGSSHKAGLEINHMVDQSRQTILKTLGLVCDYQVVFTSGATEANNLFLKGFIQAYPQRGNKIITSAGEHDSVLKTLQRMASEMELNLVILPLNEQGLINLSDLEEALDKETILVSIMAVNNETGAISNLSAIRHIVSRFPKCVFHSDVTQAIAKVDIDYTNVDALTFSAHKINGLKGSGALILKKSLTIKPLFDGGIYEGGFRQGTPDSPKNILLAKTVQLAMNGHQINHEKIREIKQKLLTFFNNHPQVIINSPRLASDYILSLSLVMHRAGVIAQGLSNQGIMVSTTSACSSKTHTASHVIFAMFNDKKRAHEVLRLSFSPFNTLEEADTFIRIFTQLLEEIHYE
jgi:cysteine desulfurase